MDKNQTTGWGGPVTYDPGRIGDWSQCWSGKRFYPLDPRPEDVTLFDIAQSLATISRYNGHCGFYSVAEHSVLVSRMVPPEDALHGLLHDASEAYTGDLTRPMKRNLKGSSFFEIEEQISKLIYRKAGISEELPESVKLADSQICIIEREDLHPRADEWDLPYPRPDDVEIRQMPPEVARTAFIERFIDLTVLDRDEAWRLKSVSKYYLSRLDNGGPFTDSMGRLFSV